MNLKRTRLMDEQLAEAEAASNQLEGTAHCLTGAMDFLLRNWRPSLIKKTIRAAAAEFLENKYACHLRSRTLQDHRTRVNRLVKACGDRHYCQINPVAKIDTARVEAKEPEILTLAEVRAILNAALDYKERVLVPYMALSLFAGLRPAELERVRWKNIDLTGRLITVRGDAAKLRKRRTVTSSVNAASSRSRTYRRSSWASVELNL